MGTYRIVVGVDGSEGSQRALHWAAQEAMERQGTVEAITAWSWDGLETPAVVAATPAEARDWAAKDLDDALTDVRTAFPRLIIAAEVIQGQAAAVLTRAAEGANLLVLGSHGHGRMFHAVLGSVSEEVIRRATCPVVVVPVPHAARAAHKELAEAN
jgi:nucleotide-binding universal stress UspA family protein